MAKVVELPRLSDTMQEGVVARWHVAVGDKVKRGQVIAEIETDKATMEFESFDAGTVLKLVVEEGETLPLGAPIAVLGNPGEDADAALSKQGNGKGENGVSSKGAPARQEDEADEESKGDEEGEAAPKPKAATRKAASSRKKGPRGETGKADAEGRDTVDADSQAEPDQEISDEQDVQADGAARDEEGVDDDPRSTRIPASPVARRLAHEHGVTLSSIRGSGPHGRVVKADVEAAIARGSGRRATSDGTPTDAADDSGRPYVSRAPREEPLTQMRKAIARRMGESFRDTPHFYLTSSIDMERIARLRSEYNEAISGTKISINDVLILAAAKALREHPRVNSYFAGDRIVRQGDVHIGMAVAMPDGLVVPVIRFADQKTLRAISMETRDFGKRAKKRELKPQEMSGSTFTISNLGMFGIDHFSAVINPGEGAILAVGKVDTVVKVDEKGEFVPRKQMTVTLACDHRAMDGADGASFLATFKRFLELPMALFA